jgi:hypothetical protein
MKLHEALTPPKRGDTIELPGGKEGVITKVYVKKTNWGTEMKMIDYKINGGQTSTNQQRT